jgi:hypothetical protein
MYISDFLGLVTCARLSVSTLYEYELMEEDIVSELSRQYYSGATQLICTV